MKKGVKIGIIIAAIVIAALAGFAYSAIFTTATRTAYLMVDGAGVEVDTGSGWTAADDMMDLSINDKVRTNSGKATVVFYDSVIVSLEPNTEVGISELSKEHIEIEQSSGSTWHKFAKVVGVGDYKVATPRAVATIRGTEAGVQVNDDNDKILLAEGDVEIDAGGENSTLDPLEVMVINDDGTFSIMEMDLNQKAYVIRAMSENLNKMKVIRKNEIESHSGIVESMIEKYSPGKTSDQVLAEIDSADIDDNELVEKSPIKIPALDKVKAINDEIKKSQWTLKQIESGKTGKEIKQGILNKDYLPK